MCLSQDLAFLKKKKLIDSGNRHWEREAEISSYNFSSYNFSVVMFFWKEEWAFVIQSLY